MKGRLLKSKDLWYVEYVSYKTIGVVKGIMGSGHKIKDVQSLPLNLDDAYELFTQNTDYKNECKEVEFDIETVPFTTIKYAKINKQD